MAGDRPSESRALLGSFKAYTRAVSSHWRALIVSWFAGLSLFFGATIIGALRWPRWAWVGIALLGFFVAQFLAWRELQELRAKDVSDQEVIRGELEQVLSSAKYRLVMMPPLAWTVIVPDEHATHGTLRWGIRLGNQSTIPLRIGFEIVRANIDEHSVESDSGADAVILPNTDVTLQAPTIQAFPAAPNQVVGTVSYAVLYGEPEHYPQFRLTHSFKFSRNRNLKGDFLENTTNIEGPRHDPVGR